MFEHELTNLLNKAAEFGADAALRRAGFNEFQITQAEARRRYGVTRVKNWVKQGLICGIREGGLVFFNVAELERLSQISEWESDKRLQIKREVKNQQS